MRKDTGEVVPVLEEESYFRLAGVPFIAPARRTCCVRSRAGAHDRRGVGATGAQAQAAHAAG